MNTNHNTGIASGHIGTTQGSFASEKERYQRYLASREWSVLKEQVARRSGRICERCRCNPMDHVHHLTYIRKYHEKLEDLQAICKGCHDFTHAKSDVDPAKNAPVRLMGTEINNVYLAGKITGTKWRNDIAPGWSEHPGCSHDDSCYLTTEWATTAWDTVDNCVEIPHRPRKLNMTGPWWRLIDDDADCCKHGSSWGLHGSVYPMCPFCDYDSGKKSLAKVVTKDNIFSSVLACDLFFAWINSPDCFGTIAEIGLARGLGKIIVIGVPEEFRSNELWLAFRMADIVVQVPQEQCTLTIEFSGDDCHVTLPPKQKPRARQAWDLLWSRHGK